MIKNFKIVAAALLCGATAAVAAPRSPEFFAKLDAKTGSWAEYSVTVDQEAGTTSAMKMRIAAVGKTPDGTWLESRTTSVSPEPDSKLRRSLPPSIVKMLLNKDDIVTKTYVQTPRGVMDTSAMAADASRNAVTGPDATKRKKIGAEKISVPAGSFEAVRYAVSGGKVEGDVWVKSGVGPYGLIRQVVRDGGRTTTFDLLASGTGAKSEVDETQAHAFGTGMMFRRPPERPVAASRPAPTAAAPVAPPAPAAPAASAGPAADSANSDRNPSSPGLGGILGRAIKSHFGL